MQQHGDEALASDMENGVDEYGRGAEPPTRELPAPAAPEPAAGSLASSEDRCTTCGAPLAHDQRYCVECGERRGPSRFPVAQPAVEEVRTRRIRTVVPPRPSTISSGTTLVAGVGVLLLAVGLGVLIGSIANRKTTTQAAAAPQVISVQGGGSASGTGSAGAGAAAVPNTPRTPTTVHITKQVQAKLKAAAAATAPPPAAVQKKATQAAGKVLGNSKNLAPPTVTTGQKCSSNQAGCSGGTFNGNFFGP